MYLADFTKSTGAFVFVKNKKCRIETTTLPCYNKHMFVFTQTDYLGQAGINNEYI
jgi:hypothetical protein